MGLSPESSSAPAIAVSERVYIIKEKKASAEQSDIDANIRRRRRSGKPTRHHLKTWADAIFTAILLLLSNEQNINAWYLSV